MRIKQSHMISLAVLPALLSACSPAVEPAPVYRIEPPEPPEVKVVAPEPPPEVYQVKPGDTLIGISMQYDIDHRELARWNNLRNPDLIQPGQQLQLRPPANDPVAVAVTRQQAPSLQPAPAAGSVQPIQPETIIVGGNAAASAAPAPASAAPLGKAPYKKEPQAIKYAYSSALLKKLQTDWQGQQQQRTKPKPAAPAAASAAETVKPAAPTAQPASAAAAAPSATRQRYGIEWGKPAAGPVLKKYDSQSKGVDFAGKRGDPVYAAADGVVIYVGTGVKSYGRMVILRHENDYLSAYAHTDKTLVKEDQRVRRGSEIATIGDSGSDRVMLHFEVRKGGKPVDPAQVLPR